MADTARALRDTLAIRRSLSESSSIMTATPTPSTSNSSSQHKHNVTTFAVAIGVTLGLILLVAVSVAFSLIRRRRLAAIRARNEDNEGNSPTFTSSARPATLSHQGLLVQSPGMNTTLSRSTHTDEDDDDDEYDLHGLGHTARENAPAGALEPSALMRQPVRRTNPDFVPRFFAPEPEPPPPPPYIGAPGATGRPSSSSLPPPPPPPVDISPCQSPVLSTPLREEPPSYPGNVAPRCTALDTTDEEPIHPPPSFDDPSSSRLALPPVIPDHSTMQRRT